MKIQYSKKFLSGFQRLENKDKVLVIDTIDLFCEDPQNVALHNHPLRKPMYSQRAISASNNLRLVFREK